MSGFDVMESALFCMGAASYTHDACKRVKAAEHKTAEKVREFPEELDYREVADALEALYRQAADWLDEAAQVISENKADLWAGEVDE